MKNLVRILIIIFPMICVCQNQKEEKSDIAKIDSLKKIMILYEWLHGDGRSYREKVKGNKLEITISDTCAIHTDISTDTLGLSDYENGEKEYFVFGEYNRYDTVVVFFNKSKRDTFMLKIYNGYQDNLYKEWFENGKIKTIENSKQNINKSWYSNGNLRWDKVANSNLSAYGYSVNVKNKTWYSDGKIRSEFIKIDTNTMSFISYYKSGQTKYKCYYDISTDTSNSDGYVYPDKYIHPTEITEEFYCENGQIVFRNILQWKVMKDYKTYYCNGNIKSRNDYFIEGYSCYGKFEIYYPDGKIKRIGAFTPYNNDEHHLMQAEPTGEWKDFDINGNLVKVENFDNYKRK